MVSAARSRPVGTVLLLLVVAGLVFQAATFGTRDVDAWGYDEVTHVQLPAARLVHATGVRDALEVVNDCDQYPPLAPLYLAAVQGVLGVGEGTARAALWTLWVLGGLGGLAVLGRSLVRRLGLPREVAPLLPALALLSPLAWRYAPSLFLEVPFLVVSTWTVVAWLARQGSAESWRRRRELAAGLLCTAAFFTKFNYGGQLGAALALDWLLETLGEARARRLRPQLARSVWLFAPALAAFLWWFVYPWPGGVLTGETHWERLLGFLAGNVDRDPTPWAHRALHWGTGVLAHPAWLALAVAGVVCALVRHTVGDEGLRPELRCLWLLLILLVVPAAAHPFHLDRFLIPALLPLLALASIGASGLLGRPRTLAAIAGVAGLLWVSVPNHTLARALGVLEEDSARATHQAEVIDRDWSLGGEVPTAGLPRATYDELAGLLVAAVGPGERVAWIGLSSELSRAAVHLILLDAQGDVARFRRDAHEPMDVTLVPGQPPAELDAEARSARLAELTAAFDVILFSAPADLKGRPRPGFYEAWQAPLVTELGWRPTELGKVKVPREDGDPLDVLLFAVRPPAPADGG